jgi:hypothetical protein
MNESFHFKGWMQKPLRAVFQDRYGNLMVTKKEEIEMIVAGDKRPHPLTQPSRDNAKKALSLNLRFTG